MNNAGSGSRILRLRRKIPLLFGEKNLKTVCFDSSIFSEGQKDGSSIERQTATIESYVQRNDLDLVETFIDDGFSASKGHHLSHGKLGKEVLPAIDAGKYRGYALVVEKMDRFSRLGIDETRMLIRRVIQGGVELHLADSGRVARSLFVQKTRAARFIFNKEADDYFVHLSKEAIAIQVGSYITDLLAEGATSEQSPKLLGARLMWFNEQLDELPKEFDDFLKVETVPNSSKKSFSARFNPEQPEIPL